MFTTVIASAGLSGETVQADAVKGNADIGKGLNLGLVFDQDYSKVQACMNEPGGKDEIRCGKYYRVVL
ncbi:MAG: hypothetical protein KDJ38_11945 [Gammaproteobacteria bacterium]|nr:hypothetical protein [Gammaproteobacteria bacterium]